MKKLFVSLAAAIVVMSSMSLVSFAGNVVNAPPSNLNIVVTNDLTNFAGINSNTFAEWNNSVVDAQVVSEGSNKLISLKKLDQNFSIVQFPNNSVSITDYVTANSGNRPYGIAMYVRTGDADVEIWTMRLHDAEDSWAKDLFLYDMNGQLVTSNADNETQSDNGVVIPFEFEGYLIVTFRDTMSYLVSNYIAWWQWSDPDGVLYVDNFGYVTAAPTEPVNTPTATNTATATPTVTPTVTPTATPEQTNSETPENTQETGESNNPSTGAPLILSAVIASAVSAAYVLRRKTK